MLCGTVLARAARHHRRAHNPRKRGLDAGQRCLLAGRHPLRAGAKRRPRRPAIDAVLACPEEDAVEHGHVFDVDVGGNGTSAERRVAAPHAHQARNTVDAHGVADPEVDDAGAARNDWNPQVFRRHLGADAALPKLEPGERDVGLLEQDAGAPVGRVDKAAKAEAPGRQRRRRRLVLAELGLEQNGCRCRHLLGKRRGNGDNAGPKVDAVLDVLWVHLLLGQLEPEPVRARNAVEIDKVEKVGLCPKLFDGGVEVGKVRRPRRGMAHALEERFGVIVANPHGFSKNAPGLASRLDVAVGADVGGVVVVERGHVGHVGQDALAHNVLGNRDPNNADPGRLAVRKRVKDALDRLEVADRGVGVHDARDVARERLVAHVANLALEPGADPKVGHVALWFQPHGPARFGAGAKRGAVVGGEPVLVAVHVLFASRIQPGRRKRHLAGRVVGLLPPAGRRLVPVWTCKVPGSIGAVAQSSRPTIIVGRSPSRHGVGRDGARKGDPVVVGPPGVRTRGLVGGLGARARRGVLFGDVEQAAVNLTVGGEGRVEVADARGGRRRIPRRAGSQINAKEPLDGRVAGRVTGNVERVVGRANDIVVRELDAVERLRRIVEPHRVVKKLVGVPVVDSKTVLDIVSDIFFVHPTGVSNRRRRRRTANRAAEPAQSARAKVAHDVERVAVAVDGRVELAVQHVLHVVRGHGRKLDCRLFRRVGNVGRLFGSVHGRRKVKRVGPCKRAGELKLSRALVGCNLAANLLPHRHRLEHGRAAGPPRHVFGEVWIGLCAVFLSKPIVGFVTILGFCGFVHLFGHGSCALQSSGQAKQSSSNCLADGFAVPHVLIRVLEAVWAWRSNARVWIVLVLVETRAHCRRVILVQVEQPGRVPRRPARHKHKVGVLIDDFKTRLKEVSPVAALDNGERRRCRAALDGID